MNDLIFEEGCKILPRDVMGVVMGFVSYNQWREKVCTINEEYHSRYRYNESRMCVSSADMKCDTAANWRNIGDRTKCKSNKIYGLLGEPNEIAILPRNYY